MTRLLYQEKAFDSPNNPFFSGLAGHRYVVAGICRYATAAAGGRVTTGRGGRGGDPPDDTEYRELIKRDGAPYQSVCRALRRMEHPPKHRKKLIKSKLKNIRRDFMVC